MKHKADLFALVTFIAGGGLGIFSQPLGSLFPAHGTQIVNGIAIVSGVAGLVSRLYSAPSSSGTALVTDEKTGTPVEVLSSPAPPPEKS